MFLLPFLNSESVLKFALDMTSTVVGMLFSHGHAVGLSAEIDGLLCKIDGEFFNRFAICEIRVLTVGCWVLM